MKRSLVSRLLPVTLAVCVTWLSMGATSPGWDGVIGGFCTANASCTSTIVGANCVNAQGNACGATHDECLSNGEASTKTCKVSTKNCNQTAGCQAHSDCSCN